jgi:glycolate oxidase
MSKISTGYDLTQLIIGSEGTLALVTEVTVKLVPRLAHSATVLAPFGDFDQVMAAVPKLISSGLNPTIVEYIDNVVMAAIVNAENLELGIPESIREACDAYLVVALENNHADRLDEDAATLGELLSEWGALDAYVLQGNSARRLIVARENVFWTAKAIGADDIIDVVVPRASMPEFLRRARDIALAEGVGMSGCGHAGDGNVHGVLFCKDPQIRKKILTEVFAMGMSLGGAISGEHGVGRAKADYFCELEDPVKLALMRRIKESFDPAGILNPGAVFV